jgi:hypothetical protein
VEETPRRLIAATLSANRKGNAFFLSENFRRNTLV